MISYLLILSILISFSNAFTPFYGNTMIGIYAENTNGYVTDYGNWFGKNVSLAHVFTGQASESDFLGSIGWCIWSNGWTGEFVVSIPLFWSGCTLAAAANGSYNADYVQAAQNLFSSNAGGQSVIYVRTGWEQNLAGNVIWSATTAPDTTNYIGAYQQFVTQFRSVDTQNRIKFVWCPNIGGNNPEDTYPGDDYVDVIGMDFYYFPQWDSADPTDAWNYFLTESYGLNWLTTFANSHGKRISIPEWGIDVDNFGTYVQLMADWLETNNVLYANYWESNGAYPGKLSDNQYPETGAAYKFIFGVNATTSITSNSITSNSITSNSITSHSTVQITTGSVKSVTSSVSTLIDNVPSSASSYSFSLLFIILFVIYTC